VPTFVDSGVSRGQLGGSPTVVNLTFLDRTCEHQHEKICSYFLGSSFHHAQRRNAARVGKTVITPNARHHFVTTVDLAGVTLSRYYKKIKTKS
jgi:hypothetical protein